MALRNVMFRVRTSKKTPEQELKYLYKKYGKSKASFLSHALAHGFPNDFAERYYVFRKR